MRPFPLRAHEISFLEPRLRFVVFTPRPRTSSGALLAKLVSTCGCGVASDSTSELLLNGGHGTASDAGSPFAASSPTPLACWRRAPPESSSAWPGRARSAVEEVLDLRRVRCNRQEVRSAKICGAVSSSNSYANVGTRLDVQRSTCSAGHAKFASETKTLRARIGAGYALSGYRRDLRRPGRGHAEHGCDHVS